MQGQYSLRSPAVKRLMKEAQELREPTEQYHAQPLEDNLFEWHFTIRGPADSEFNGGIYHGRIILPPEYPMKPPSIIVLTPNGRFETHTKICLSISGHHPESWQPSWSIRTALLAIIGFMPTHGAGAMGSLDYTPEERKRLAKKSLEYKCPVCGGVKDLLRPVTAASKSDSEEAKELASQINFQSEKQKSLDNSDQKQQDTKENVAPPSAANTPAPSLPGMMMPAWTQMPGASFGYNPAMSQAASGVRVPATGPVPQMAPFMPLAQFMAMQAMMQQQMHGMVPPQMMGPGWGMPGSVPGAMPGFPVPQAPVTPTSNSPSANSKANSAVTSVGSSTSLSTSSNPGSPVNNISTTNTDSPTSANVTPSRSTPSVSQPPDASTVGQGVRQRTTASGSETTTSSDRPANSNTGTQGLARSRSSQPLSGLTQVTVAILAIGILILLIRRLSMMGILSFDQNAEL